MDGSINQKNTIEACSMIQSLRGFMFSGGTGEQTIGAGIFGI
jgi:hypothetical protein